MADDAGGGNFVELIDEIHRFYVLHIGFAVRRRVGWAVSFGVFHSNFLRPKMEHDGSFHFAGMTHASQLRFPMLPDSLGAQAPIGRIDGMEAWYLAELCLQFAERGPDGHIIAAMAVKQEYLSTSHADDRAGEVHDQVNVIHLGNAECTRKKQVMGGVPCPKSGQQQNVFRTRRLNSLGDGRHYISVGGEWEMRAVLLE